MFFNIKNEFIINKIFKNALKVVLVEYSEVDCLQADNSDWVVSSTPLDGCFSLYHPSLCTTHQNLTLLLRLWKISKD